MLVILFFVKILIKFFVFNWRIVVMEILLLKNIFVLKKLLFIVIVGLLFIWIFILVL